METALVIEEATSLEIVSAPKSDIRNEAVELSKRHQKVRYYISKILENIYTNDLWKAWVNIESGKSFETFDEYIEAELRLHPRSARIWVGMGRVIREQGIDETVLIGVDWTKFGQVCSIIDGATTPDDLTKLIDLARDSTFKEVEKFVKTAKTEKVGGTPETSVCLKFKCSIDQSATIERALKDALGELTSDNHSQALEYICMSWSVNHDPDAVIKFKGLLSTPIEEDRAPIVKPYINKGKARA